MFSEKIVQSKKRERERKLERERASSAGNAFLLCNLQLSLITILQFLAFPPFLSILFLTPFLFKEEMNEV